MSLSRLLRSTSERRDRARRVARATWSRSALAYVVADRSRYQAIRQPECAIVTAERRRNGMGLYKRCQHKGRSRDRCEHEWHGSFQHQSTLHRTSLSKWANEDIKSKQQAQTIYE